MRSAGQTPQRFQPDLNAVPPEMTAFARRFMRGVSPPTEAHVDALGEALLRGDPLADAWVEFAAEHLSHQRAQEWVERAINHGIDRLYQPPESLIALFEDLERVPLWLDDDLLDLARRTVRRSGPVGNWLLVNVALMGGYRYEGVIQPLLMTGRLTDYAPRRLADTTQFVQDVISERGLHRSGRGYRAVIRVRLLHAHIRYHLRRSKDWSNDRWGEPINQADMLATQLLFSLSYLVTGSVMGASFSARETQSVIHLWRYVGHLIGIDAHLLPATEEEARRAFYLIGITQSLAGEEVAQLGRALHEVPLSLADSALSRLSARASMSIRAGISRLFLGDEAMDHLGLPKSKARFAVLGAIPFIYSAERVRRLVPGATRLATLCGGALQDLHARRLVKRTRER